MRLAPFSSPRLLQWWPISSSITRAGMPASSQSGREGVPEIWGRGSAGAKVGAGAAHGVLVEAASIAPLSACQQVVSSDPTWNLAWHYSALSRGFSERG